MTNGRDTIPTVTEVCTKEHPNPQAPLHPDAVVISRDEEGAAWPKWSCPHCGLEAEIQVDTELARKILGQI